MSKRIPISSLHPEIKHYIQEAYRMREELDEIEHKLDLEVRAKEIEFYPAIKEKVSHTLEVVEDIPEFWLQTLMHSELGNLITTEDSDLLKYLRNLTYYIEYSEDISTDIYTLEFYFNKNPIIKNIKITKKYWVTYEGRDDYIERTVCDVIEWIDRDAKNRNNTNKTKIDKFIDIFYNYDINSEFDYDISDKLLKDHEILEKLTEDVIPECVRYYLNEVDDEAGEVEEVVDDMSVHKSVNESIEFDY